MARMEKFSRHFPAFQLSLILTCGAAAAASLYVDDSRIVQVTDKNFVGGSMQSPLLSTERRFQAFVREYGKEYSSRGEYLRRLRIFAGNVARAAEHQSLDPTAVHGVTPFSDLSEEEFEQCFTGLRGGGWPEAMFPSAPVLEAAADSPENFDWREKGAVTDVKFQGTCGACWAFSTTGVIEGANFLATGKLLNLSEQQLVDCDDTVSPSSSRAPQLHQLSSSPSQFQSRLKFLQCDEEEKDACNNGCNGGLMTNAYKYMMDAGGLQDENSYPYTGARGECRFDPAKAAVKVANFTKIPLQEDQIIASLLHRGPLAVGLNAAFMQTYIGGVSCPLICPKRFINHGVLLVGYGARGFSLLRMGKRPYWIIKNSWGKQWGEGGFYRLCRGYNMCGINNMASVVATASV